jgi:ribosomal protein S18 acetylase RimI-like enzyme
MTMNMKTSKVTILQAASPTQLEAVRDLFLEYARSLGFSLCFQGFDKELAELPGSYAPPEGRLLLAEVDGDNAGCVALHKLASDVCEMKRLYVRPQFRGAGMGRLLTEASIAEARAIGYKKMRLDTIVGKMDQAIELYRQLGFREMDPYRPNPIPGALYMERALT